MNNEKIIDNSVYKTYDTFISYTYLNINNFQNENNNKIILEKFKYRNNNHKFVYIVSDLIVLFNNNVNIYLDMPLFSYLYFKFKMRKRRKFYRYNKFNKNGIDIKINIDDLLYNVCKTMEVDTTIVNDIYNTYYK